MTPNDERLLRLIQERDATEKTLKRINEEIHETNLAVVFERYGVKIGSIVASTAKNTEGKLFKVMHFGFFRHNMGKPWLTGNPQTKDGTYGTAKRNLYTEWELVSSGEP